MAAVRPALRSRDSLIPSGSKNPRARASGMSQKPYEGGSLFGMRRRARGDAISFCGHRQLHHGPAAARLGALHL